MKRVSVATIISIVILAVLLREFMIYSLFSGRDRSRRQYEILRLSSESNTRGNGEDYFIRYMNSEKILRYSFETGEATEYYIDVPEGMFIRNGGAVVDDKVYYVLSSNSTGYFDDTVRRFDCRNQVDEEILSEEDILIMCGLDYLPGDVKVSITRSKRCILLSIKKNTFICPIDGDFKTDFVEINSLFPEEDKTGAEQVILYQGMRIKRHYDVDREEYEIIELREAEWKISLHHDWGASDYSYSVEENAEEHEIDCLNETEYQYAQIQECNLTTENGAIIGLLHVPINLRCNPFYPSQKELKYDVLFRLDPETGENSILYRARNNRTRIIGYQDGVIYLMNNYRIYTKTAKSGETKQFLKLPGNTSYKFDWQGDYLIVMRGYEIYGAYKIR